MHGTYRHVYIYNYVLVLNTHSYNLTYRHVIPKRHKGTPHSCVYTRYRNIVAANTARVICMWYIIFMCIFQVWMHIQPDVYMYVLIYGCKQISDRDLERNMHLKFVITFNYLIHTYIHTYLRYRRVGNHRRQVLYIKLVWRCTHHLHVYVCICTCVCMHMYTYT